MFFEGNRRNIYIYISHIYTFLARFFEKRVSRKSRSNYYESFARDRAFRSLVTFPGYELNVRKSRYANPWPRGGRRFTGIEGCFSVHRSRIDRECVAGWTIVSWFDGSFVRAWKTSRKWREGHTVLEEDGIRAVIGIPHKLCLGVSEFMRELLSSTDVRVIVKTPSLYYSACYATVNNFDWSCKHYTTEIWIPFWWISLNFNPLLKIDSIA